MSHKVVQEGRAWRVEGVRRRDSGESIPEVGERSYGTQVDGLKVEQGQRPSRNPQADGLRTGKKGGAGPEGNTAPEVGSEGGAAPKVAGESGVALKVGGESGPLQRLAVKAEPLWRSAAKAGLRNSLRDRQTQTTKCDGRIYGQGQKAEAKIQSGS